MYNKRGAQDARHVISGKDGLLYSESGLLLATIETYQVKINVSTASYQPLGDPQEHKHMTGYGININCTETVIEDTEFFQQLINMTQSGNPMDAMWTFQTVLKGRNGSEERMIYRDCVPDGNTDLQNVSIGDLIKRAWSMWVNRPPELQSLLSYTD